MENLDKFENVLQNDEKAIAITSANKKVYVVKRILIPLILFVVTTVILTIVAILNPRHYIEETGVGIWKSPGYYEGFPLWILFLVSGILLFILLFVLFISNTGSKNYFICLTNKRIIVRKGAFTTNYTYYSIDNVSGNITLRCSQSIFEKNNNSCSLSINIELLPVGHNELSIWTPSLIQGYDFSKLIDKQVKENSKPHKKIKA